MISIFILEIPSESVVVNEREEELATEFEGDNQGAEETVPLIKNTPSPSQLIPRRRNASSSVDIQTDTNVARYQQGNLLNLL